MLLQSIIDGSNSSNISIIQETADVTATGIIFNILKSEDLKQRSDLIHFVSFQHQHHFLTKLFKSRNLFVHDGYTDPLRWNTNSKISSPVQTKVKAINVFSNLIDQLKITTKEYLKRSEAKITVIIDGLSVLLRHKSIHEVCKMINSLTKLKNRVQVNQVIATVQKDVVSQSDLNALAFIADTSIVLDLHQSKASRNNRGFQSESSKFEADITVRKKSGKVLRERILCMVSKDFSILKLSDVDQTENNEDEAKEADPTENLSFNLKLTDSEKQARSQVKLPYMLDQEQKAVHLDRTVGSGKIIYEPDDADDFDEEDPDEDLDI